MNKITAIIVIKGNPPYLAQSLAAVDTFVDEIIIGVIDVQESLLNKLKKNKKVKISVLDSLIPFADIVKEELKKSAKGDHILYVDPDEIFSQKTIDLLKKNMNKFDYFLIPRKNIIFGKWMKHSRWWPDYQLRFFKKNKVIWPETIHPIPKTTGQGFTIPAEEELAIQHYNYDNLSQYFEKSFRYARAEAKKAARENKTITISETFKKSLNEFISRYFSGEGYRDGSRGFVLAILQMFYYVLVYVFYWEEKKYIEIDNETVFKETQSFFIDGSRETNFWLNNKKLIDRKNSIKFKIINRLIHFLKL